MNEILANLMTVLDEEHARAVVDHRRVTMKKPLTAFGAKLLAKHLAAWGNAAEAAEIMIERCWQGFDPTWVKNRTQQFTPFAGNRKPNAVDAMQQIFEERGWTNNEPEFLQGDNRNGECLPAERGERQGVVVDLRAGAYRRG
jgi:hypothetical protein